MTDNGPAYKSADFALFIARRPELAHVRTRHHSPETNGVVERFNELDQIRAPVPARDPRRVTLADEAEASGRSTTRSALTRRSTSTAVDPISRTRPDPTYPSPKVSKNLTRDTRPGAFTQLDTTQGAALNPLSLNRYLYAEANPETFTDPSGHVTIDEGDAYSSTLTIDATHHHSVHRHLSTAQMYPGLNWKKINAERAVVRRAQLTADEAMPASSTIPARLGSRPRTRRRWGLGRLSGMPSMLGSRSKRRKTLPPPLSKKTTWKSQ